MSGLSRTPWLDEVATLRVVSATTWRAWAGAVLQEPSPPAFQALLTLWGMVSHHLAWLRLLPVLAIAGMVVIGARWGARVSRRAAWTVGLLLALSPFLLRYALELRGYALLALASTAVWSSAWDVATASDGAARRRSQWTLTLALGVACATHFTAVLLLPAAAALIVVARPLGSSRRVPVAQMIGIATMWAGELVVFRSAVGLVRGDWWMPALDASLAGRTLAEVAGLSTSGHGPGVWAIIVGVGLAGLMGAVVAWSPRSRVWLAPCAAAVVYVGGLAVVSWVWQPVWWPRTLVPAWTALVCGLAVASASIEPARQRRVSVAALGCVLLGWGATWASARPSEGLEPWARVAMVLAADPAPRAVLAYPDFVAWPLVQGLDGAHRVDVSGLRADGRGTDEVLAAVAQREGRTYLVLRVDPGVQGRREGLARLLDGLVASIGVDGRLTVLLVMSQDVSLMPQLTRWQRDVTALLVPRFGDGVMTQAGERLSVVRFERRAR